MGKLIMYEEYHQLYPKEVLNHNLGKIVKDNILFGPVLDVGCGNGSLLMLLKDDFECKGFDPSEIAIKLSKEKGIDAEVADIQSFQPKKKYKTILIIDVLASLSNVEKDLERVISWLDENGEIFVHIANRGSLRRLLNIGYNPDDDSKFLFYPTYWEFKKTVKKVGLDIVRSYGGGIFKHLPIFSLAIFYILERKRR